MEKLIKPQTMSYWEGFHNGRMDWFIYGKMLEMGKSSSYGNYASGYRDGFMNEREKECQEQI